MSYEQVWDSTPAEIYYLIREQNRIRKEQYQEHFADQYNLSKMISTFVNMQMGGKQIPSLQEMAPNLFSGSMDSQVREDGLTEAEYKRACFQKDQWIMIAEAQRKKKEGQTDNGDTRITS